MENHLKSLRAVYDLADAHIFPTLGGNHLICRLDPACTWTRKLRDNQVRPGPVMLEEHVRMHVEAEARYLREVRYASPPTNGTAIITAVRNCNWRYCGEAFHGAEQLVAHIMQEHAVVAVVARCPACEAFIGAATTKEMTAASAGEWQYLLMGHYGSGQCQGLKPRKVSDEGSQSMIQD
ncbi:hypothetical protein BD626DRAFT_540247 [Schizophyllum amplum]|uniref:C2H2-type domain-containing protein n=1 Tax=Schizophyllum amplum TaxID=97359 RepID=A0A550BZS9_9AGAR|nr:hypothetical protein BD626DRAFT_540247 [Auriculariopsis ampla]